MKTWISSLVNLFYPPLCAGCHKRLVSGERQICIDCLDQIPKTQYHQQKENRLEEFFAGRIPFQRVACYAYFFQNACLQSVIHELKYGRNAALGVFLGELYGSYLKGSDFLANVDCIVPVPLHPRRERKRGYNQSLEIAKGLSKQTGIPIEQDVLIRLVDNPSQTHNSRFDRWENVTTAFALTNVETLAGKHILLIDDVITTGSTLEACAKEVLKSKNSSLSIAAIGVAT